MIKIEKMSKDAKASIKRVTVSGESEIGLYAGMLMSLRELSTLKVLSGSVTYSIDEMEIITQHAKPNVNTTNVSDSVSNVSDSINTTITNSNSSDPSNSPTSTISSSVSDGTADLSNAGNNISGNTETIPKKVGRSIGRTVKAK